MKAIFEAIKALWKLLTEVGAAQTISSGIASYAVVTWTYIQGAKTSHLFFVAAVTFCLVFLTYNSVRFIVHEVKQYPDYAEWDRVSALAIWQASCLWAGIKPVAQIPPTSKAYPCLQMLKRDLERGEFKTLGQEDGVMWRLVEREELKIYAQKKGEKPPFLFPENR